jgi:glucose-1-phosphate adenylyltransferase
MSRPKILALIMAGGEGGRLDVLTKLRPKPALPYAGIYRLIDFPLSNCMHSGLSDVWVIEQYEPQLLNDHLANGRPWDLDRTHGGLRVVPPHRGAGETGWDEGNADALYKNRRAIRELGPELVLVLSADAVYKLDYLAVVEHHRQARADVTVVATRVPLEQASRFGTLKVDERGCVTDFQYKPKFPKSDIVTVEVFVYDASKLLETLEELASDNEDGSDADSGSGLKDFGHTLLPRMVQDGRAYEYRFDGYWRDMGTLESYWQGHMDLLAAEPRLALDERDWPIVTLGVQRAPARIHESAHIDDSLISPGCTIYGHVARSVVGPGVVVAQGASVRDAVLLDECVVGPRATIECAILDQGACINEAAQVGAPLPQAAHSQAQYLTLLGQKAQIGAGSRIEAGRRVEPGESA